MVKSGTANNASAGDERKLKNGILERWAAVVARKGEEKAVLMPRGEIARTFSDIEAEAGEIAARLVNLLPGEVVSLQAPNVPQWPAMLLGVWKAGGCALLLDHTLGRESRDEAERSCGAVRRLEVVEGTMSEVHLGHSTKNFGGAAPDVIKLTSGTSGAARAILFTAAQLEADCDNVCEAMDLHEDDVNYGVVAFSHSYGFSNLITPLVCRGIPLVAARDALPRAVMAGVVASKAAVLPAVPAVFQALSGVDGGDMPTLRLCVSAGAPLRVETARAFRERFGLKVHAFYGASECGGIAYDASEDEISAPGFVGNPLPRVEIEAAEGRQISVRSAAVGLGYFPSDTGELGTGRFQPSDLLEKGADGWHIVGRSSEVINIGGKKTSPQEIEKVLLSHPAVREAAVFGIGSDARTESVCACVVIDGDADVTALRVYCAERLAPWQVPRSIFRLEAIPVNARGKVSRVELATRFVRNEF